MARAAVSASMREQTWLDRIMSLAAEVQPGEAATALLLSLNLFLLLTAYYIIRPVREALILAGQGGAEIKSYTGAFHAVLFLFIVPAYGAFASKVNRIQLINWVTLFFTSNLVIFYLLGRSGVRLGIPFFLWMGIFNLMVVAQLWSFANDLYTPEQGKRLFAMVGVGASVGAVAGSEIAGILVRPLGVFAMMLVSAGLLLVCLLLTNIILAREKRRIQSPSARQKADEPLAKEGGFQLVLRHRYLLFIGLLALLDQLANTNGEYILGSSFSRAAREAVAGGMTGGLSERQLIASYYASFHFWQNLLSALIQIFLVSRILKYLGVRGALLTLPLISLGGYALLVAAPLLPFIRAYKIVENSTDYSLQNTVRRALFLSTSREAKYKTLQAVETFFWRSGDMLSGAAVFVGTGLLGLGLRSFAVLNVGLAIGWLLLVARLAREHQKLTAGLEVADA